MLFKRAEAKLPPEYKGREPDDQPNARAARPITAMARGSWRWRGRNATEPAKARVANTPSRAKTFAIAPSARRAQLCSGMSLMKRQRTCSFGIV